MAAADVVLLASGTATLEAMLLKRPMVVTYRLTWLGYAIVKRLIKSPFVSLPNILSGKEMAPELIQAQATPQNMAREIVKQLEDSRATASIRDHYTDIHQQLKQDASNTAADAVLRCLAGENRHE